jgi:nitroimidazol reductase NimA-like FMN-containing flavoprotein (pyridoxamine 5'-phosphate oxidase superfamily)
MDRSRRKTPHAAARGARTQPAREIAGLSVGIGDLSREDSLALLARHHVGHVGISFHDILRVELAAYVYSDDWIYARMALGDELTTVRHHPWGAFQVDEVESIYDWRSVEVRGAVQFLSSNSHGHDWFEFANAVRLMREVVPQVLTPDDPLPQRSQIVRLHIDDIRGRVSQSSAPAALPPP